MHTHARTSETLRFATLFAALSLGCALPVAAGVDVWTTNGPYVTESVGSARRVTVDPQTPTTLYAGENISDDCGASLLKSTNGGDSWQTVLDAIDCVSAIIVDPVDPHIVHVAVDGGFYVSADSGISWQGQTLPASVQGEFITSLALDQARPTVLYAGTGAQCLNQYNCTGHLLKSSDGGRSWNQIAAYDTSVNAIAIGSDAAVYVAGGTDYSQPSGDTPARPGFLVRSVDDGATWVDVDPLPGAFVSQLALSPFGGRLHAATATTMYGSDDRGASWHPEPAQMPINQLAVDPLQPRNVYAIANRFSDGVFSTQLQYSADAGESWTTLAGPPDIKSDVSPGALLVTPTQPATLYVAFSQQLYRTTDLGSTWIASGLGLGSVVTARLAIDPFDGTLHATADTVYRSADRAATWSPRGAVLQFLYDIAFDPKRNGTIYVTSFDGVRKSVDGARTWQAINHGLPYQEGSGVGLASGVLAIDPGLPDVLYLGAGALYTSGDGGESWTMAHNGLPDDVDVRTLLATKSAVYAGAFPGLYASTDRGDTWHSLNIEPAGIHYVTDLAADPRHPERLYAAAFEGLARSLDAGSTWTDLTAGALIAGQACTSIAISPLDSSTLYVGTYEGVFRSRDAGATWQSFSPGMTGNYIVDLLIEPSDPRVVYAATQFDGVYTIEQSDVAAPATPTPANNAGGCAVIGDPPPSAAALTGFVLLVLRLRSRTRRCAAVTAAHR